MEKGVISYGQHYLENEDIKKCLIESAKLNKNDVVIEVGAGDGRITNLIAEKVRQVVAYEIDEKTKDVLLQLQNKEKNIEIIFENFLTAKLPEANKIVASLPYQITEPFLEKIKLIKNLESVTLLVGKTFGKLANEGEKFEVTKLLLLLRCYFKSEYICDVSKENFNPPPKTISSMIHLLPKCKAELVEQPELFVMREIFQQRDKRVSNALREGIIRFYAEKGLVKTKRETKDLINQYFDAPELDEYLEQMNNQKIANLFNKLTELLKKN